MPRNGSGTFSLATTFTPDTDALAEDVNTQFEDIRDAITGSVAADGQTPITGAMKFTDGSAAAPGITFAADTNSGVYRIGADSYGLAAGGAEIARVTSAGFTLASGKNLVVPGTITATGGFASGGILAPGDLVIFAGPIANIPTGRLLCDGSAVSRTTYASLFAAIGTMHGSGDGSTTFNLPDLRDKFVIGAKQDDTGVAKTNVTGALTQSGGSKDAVSVAHSHTASSAVTDPGHFHSVLPEGAGTGAGAGNYLTGATANSSYGNLSTGSKTTGITVATTVNSDGVSGTNQNLPPYYALAFTIQT